MKNLGAGRKLVKGNITGKNKVGLSSAISVDWFTYLVPIKSSMNSARATKPQAIKSSKV